MRSPAGAPPHTLLVVHIPKAGGTTFRRIVHRQATRPTTYSLHPTQPQASIEAFKQLPSEQRAAFRLIEGHMPFGLHTALAGPATYVTVLRDPVERLISYYYYVLASPTHYLYRRVTTQRLSLLDFASLRTVHELDNDQTRRLAAADGCQLPAPVGELTPAMLDMALRNLDAHFAVAGLAEHFDLTLLLLRARLGWAYPSLFYRRENRTANRLPLDAIAPEVIDVIRQRHVLDLALYDFAHQRLRQQAAEYLPQPERALARFARWNRLYQRGAELFNRARWLVPRPLRDQARRWRQARNRPR